MAHLAVPDSDNRGQRAQVVAMTIIFGESFQCEHCMECERDREFWDGSDGDGCEIAVRATAHLENDPDFPVEITEDGCTAFVPLGGQVPTDKELEQRGQLTLLAA